MTSEREVTAIHEAGHCLVKERLGYRVSEAWIDSNNDENGKTRLEFKAWLKRCIRCFSNPEENVMIIISGDVVQKQFFPDSEILPSDKRDLNNFILRFRNVDVEKSNQELQKILSKGRNLEVIKEIAQILDTDGKITGQEIRAIIVRIDLSPL